jgi:glycosyltransferase involved in cell wall biosynthesis
MSARLTTTLLLPMLNEIEAARVIIPQIRREWVDEIVVIDGGSSDGTIEYVKSQGLRVESQAERGFGAGMLQGLRQARGDIVIEFMPDGNSIPDDIPRLIAKMEEGHDLVIASRYVGGLKSDDDDWLTALGNRIFTLIVNILFGARYTDVLVGTRAFRRDKGLALDFDASGLSWPCQSSIRFARAGFKTAEIAAREPRRIGGERKMRPFWTGWEICKLIIRDFLTFWPSAKVRSWR